MSLVKRSAAYSWKPSYAGETRILPHADDVDVAATPTDLVRTLRGLMRSFPGWLVWRGRVTGRWWALPPAVHPRQALIEAATPNALAALIQRAHLGL
jgi:hypothetical protein